MGNLRASPDSACVHLCIDMQRLFGAEGPWPTPWLEKVLPTVVRLVEHCPERCIFTRFIPASAPDHAGGTWGAYYRKWKNVTRGRMDQSLIELVPDLARYVPPARVFDKNVYSAFFTGDLHAFLRAKNITTLIVSGSETDVCVLSTVLAAVDFGYRVIVVEDALCSSADETHDALLALYAKRFELQIELAEADEVLQSWRV
jgi:nicotinamidase-related amidase